MVNLLIRTLEWKTLEITADQMLLEVQLLNLAQLRLVVVTQLKVLKHQHARIKALLGQILRGMLLKDKNVQIEQNVLVLLKQQAHKKIMTV